MTDRKAYVDAADYADLAQRANAEVERLGRLYDAREAEVLELLRTQGRLRKLCRGRQAEAVGGGLTDVDTLWPSEVLAILDERSP